MARQPKNSRRPTKTAPLEHAASSPSDEPPAIIARRIYSSALDAIHNEIEGIKRGSAKESRHDPASRIAFLASKAAQIAAEQRKSDAAERAETGRLTETKVWSW